MSHVSEQIDRLGLRKDLSPEAFNIHIWNGMLLVANDQIKRVNGDTSLFSEETLALVKDLDHLSKHPEEINRYTNGLNKEDRDGFFVSGILSSVNNLPVEELTASPFYLKLAISMQAASILDGTTEYPYSKQDAQKLLDGLNAFDKEPGDRTEDDNRAIDSYNEVVNRVF